MARDGTLTWTSGANTGRSVEVLRHDHDAGLVTLQLLEEPVLALAPGDTFSGQLRISGFPFNFAGGAGSITFGGGGAKPSYPAGATFVAINCAAGNNFLLISAQGDGFANALSMANLTSGATYIINASGFASI